MAEESIIKLVEKGIEGCVYAETRASRSLIIGEVMEILKALRERRIAPNIAYNAIYGVITRWRLDLTPREVAEVKRALGVL